MGTLHVVATPIGNLEDVTLRALRVLGEADLVFAEDTRRTRILLERHGITARPLSLHAHNERSRVARALEALEGEGRVALVSDAGTPLVSDPGERLVAAAIAAGHRVEAVPGASAVLAALTVSGFAPQPFTFVGFLPRRAGERRETLARLATATGTLILFESARRLAKTLQDLRSAFGERRACVARELTKLHEEVRRGTLSELARTFEQGCRGELTIVVEGAEAGPEVAGEDEIDERIRSLLAAGGRPKEIAAQLSPETGRSRQAVYRRVLEIREEPAEPPSS